MPIGIIQLNNDRLFVVAEVSMNPEGGGFFVGEKKEGSFEPFGPEAFITEKGYKPFDIKDAIDGARKLTEKGERELSPEEKIKLARLRVEKAEAEMVEQRRGILFLERDLVERIFKNPEVQPEGLLTVVKESARKLQLNAKQLEAFALGVEEFSRRRNLVREVLNENHEGTRAFEHCFGVPPKGNVEIKRLTAGIAFFLEKDDFAALFKDRHQNKLPLTTEDLADAWGTSAFVTEPSYKHPELKDCLVACRNELLISGSDGELSLESVLKHEDGHLLEGIFALVFAKEELPSKSSTLLASPTEREAMIVEREIKSSISPQVKTELLAFLVAGEEISEVKNALKERYFPSEEVRENRAGEYRYFLDQTSVRNAFERAYHDERPRLIDHSCESLDLLLKAGCSREDAFMLLASEPLENWPAFTRRLVRDMERRVHGPKDYFESIEYAKREGWIT